MSAGRRLRRGGALLVHPDAAVLGVWAALAAVLAAVTYRIADWFKVPDELVFERLALSIARDHSLVPRIHGEFIRSLAQLYPLLISPILAHGLVASDLPQIRVLNAIVVTSAFVPAYLLALRVTGRRPVAYLVGVLSVALPWIVLASFLLTEVVALPAFLWAMLAIQAALVRPSWRRDLLALAAIAVAFLARTQFVLLLGVLPVAAVLVARRGVLRVHRLLVAVYAAGALAALAFVLSGHSLLSLSIYGEQFNRSPTLGALLGWGLGHLADLAFGLALLPFVVGTAWLLANAVRPAASREAHVFACIGATTVLLLTYAVTSFDLQLGGFIFDRYLMYLVPLVVLAFACALLDARRPRASLALPAAAVALGFLLHLQQPFTWTDPVGRLNTDAPLGIFYRPFVDAFGSRGTTAIVLAAATVLSAAAFALVARRERLVLLLALPALLLPLETGYAFHRLFAVNDWADRPLTRSNAGVLDWVDRTVGTASSVTIVPAPISSDYLVTERYWRDVEFWNKSVARHLLDPGPGAYAYTGYWFPKRVPRFDERTGAVAASPTQYVLQSVGEARFRVAGTVVQLTPEAMLVDAPRPWRLAWLTSGLSTDGWTQSDRPAEIRVYASAGATGPVAHYATLHLRAPGEAAHRRAVVDAGGERRDVDVTPSGETVERIVVCPPADGYAPIRLTTFGSSRVAGDERTIGESTRQRTGSVLVAGIFLSDETGGPCTPRATP